MSLDQVNRLLATHDLTGSELAWQPGLNEWVRLTTIPGVYATTPPPLPPDSQEDVPPEKKPITCQSVEGDDDPDMKGIRGFFYKAGALLFLFGGLWSLWSDYSFVWASSQTIGIVTSPPVSHTVGGRRTRHTEYYVDYAYKVAGQHYSGRDSVRTPPSSQSITVYYQRTVPSNSKVELPETWVGWGFSVIGLASSLLFFEPWKWFRRKTS